MQSEENSSVTGKQSRKTIFSQENSSVTGGQLSHRKTIQSQENSPVTGKQFSHRKTVIENISITEKTVKENNSSTGKQFSHRKTVKANSSSTGKQSRKLHPHETLHPQESNSSAGKQPQQREGNHPILLLKRGTVQRRGMGTICLPSAFKWCLCVLFGSEMILGPRRLELWRKIISAS